MVLYRDYSMILWGDRMEFISARQDRGVDWYEEELSSAGPASLVLVTYGKCVYWIDGEKHILDRGGALLIPQGTPYYAKSVPTILHEKYVFTFRWTGSEEAAMPLLAEPRQLEARAASPVLPLERVKTIHREMSEQVPYADVRAAGVLLEMLALWSREWEARRTPRETERQVDRMKQYIRNHSRERVTKEELGAAIGRTPNYAATLFRRGTGQTISGYVHAVRMKTAVYMLTESRLSVGEIADFLGYQDASYFHRLFKRETGLSPSHFLKQREDPVL